jgi:hypothetical protein
MWYLFLLFIGILLMMVFLHLIFKEIGKIIENWLENKKVSNKLIKIIKSKLI